MLPFITGLFGIGFGWWKAGKRGGNTADKLQYAAGFGIALFLLGYFIGLFLVKFGVV